MEYVPIDKKREPKEANLVNLSAERMDLPFPKKRKADVARPIAGPTRLGSFGGCCCPPPEERD
eukprot:11332542-Ditylum_brightwellii.AAC.1